jgi:hypothetical protein
MRNKNEAIGMTSPMPCLFGRCLFTFGGHLVDFIDSVGRNGAFHGRTPIAGWMVLFMENPIR